MAHCVSIVIPMFLDADRAINLVLALQEQCLPSGIDTEIIVVDDGSSDDSAARIEATVGKKITLLRLPINCGRATARNTGAAAASGEVLLFMDCDCLPASNELIIEHLNSWAPDVVASIGPVAGKGAGFWNYYQIAASKRRERQHATGIFFSGSSQNMMVLRKAFDACGGFDTAYCTYGFEDRDLQLRLSHSGRIAWVATAGVRHMDDLTLPLVCRKMAAAGGTSAVLFARRHPEAYRDLGYAALDARLHGWLRLPARLLNPLIEPLALCADRLIINSGLPCGLKSWIVKILTGLSYLVGTMRN
jgi:glycosyltransferase involved in cell wall biosynthesis